MEDRKIYNFLSLLSVIVSIISLFIVLAKMIIKNKMVDEDSKKTRKPVTDKIVDL